MVFIAHVELEIHGSFPGSCLEPEIRVWGLNLKSRIVDSILLESLRCGAGEKRERERFKNETETECVCLRVRPK